MDIAQTAERSAGKREQLRGRFCVLSIFQGKFWITQNKKLMPSDSRTTLNVNTAEQAAGIIPATANDGDIFDDYQCIKREHNKIAWASAPESIEQIAEVAEQTKKDNYMENKNEYICIISATVLHGLVTYLKLGSMPHIALEYIDKISITAFCLWAIYGAILYIVAQKWVKEEKSRINFIKAVVFGFCTAITKGIIDFIVARLTLKIESVMLLVVIDGVETFIFGMLLISVVICFWGKKRIICMFDKFMVELTLVGVTILLYVIMLGSYFWQNAKAIDQFSATAEEIRNLDYHFAYRIVDGNVYCYVLFYIFFWNLLRSATQDVTEKQIGVNKEQIDESK